MRQLRAAVVVPIARSCGGPCYVRIRHGSCVYKGAKLCRVDEGLSKMYEALARRYKDTDIPLVPATEARQSIKTEQLRRTTRLA